MTTASRKSTSLKAVTRKRVSQPAKVKKRVTAAVKPQVGRARQPVRPAGKDFLAAVGRRKTAIARVRLFAKGSGQVVVNELPLDKYFGLKEYVETVKQPLELTGLASAVDIRVKVAGGGKAGQAVAIRHGIARAVVMLDEKYRKQLRPAGLLTRDARLKERKKPGLKRARRAPQFSKR